MGNIAKIGRLLSDSLPIFFKEILLDYTFFVQFFDCECLL